MNSWQRNAVITSGVVLSLAVRQVNPAQAAIVNYNLAGTIETFSGTFSYDNSLLTGSDFEFLDVSQVNLNFLGSTFTAVNADPNPTVEFLDGNFLGLNFSTSSFTPEFSLIPAFGSTEATFSYIGTNDKGSGRIQYALVPEPSTVLGLIALGIGGFLVGRKRDYH
jgi:hypothetical protein